MGMQISPEMIKGAIGAMGSMQQGQQSSAADHAKEYEKTDAKLSPLYSTRSAQVQLGPERSDRVSNFAANFANVHEQNGLWREFRDSDKDNKQELAL